MDQFYLGFALFLLANVLAGLVRILRGPTPADRMLAAQLFGTTGVAVLLVMAEQMAAPPLRDGALVLALLAAVASVAFTSRSPARPSLREGGREG
jgi:multicomponent Na+:H+ antiporter subunit F